jgi:hypothetical protein
MSAYRILGSEGAERQRALRKWLSYGWRQPLPFGRRPASWLRRGPAHDVGLDQEVVSTTNHYKMFDIVAADEDDFSYAPLPVC